MNEPAGRRLVPPRPNLGPEPWSEARPTAVAVIVAAALGGLLLRLVCLEMASQEKASYRP